MFKSYRKSSETFKSSLLNLKDNNSLKQSRAKFERWQQIFHKQFGNQKNFHVWYDEVIHLRTLYIDSQRENFLWLQHKDQFILIDLCFAEITIQYKRWKKGLNQDQKFLCIREQALIVVFIFNQEEQVNKYFQLFVKYCQYLTILYPQYLVCNSHMLKIHLKQMKNRKQDRSTWHNLERTSKINGYRNNKINQQIFEYCLKQDIAYFSKNYSSKGFQVHQGRKEQLSAHAVNKYFMMQFCTIQPLWDQFNRCCQAPICKIQDNVQNIFKKVLSIQRFKKFLKVVQHERQDAIEQKTQHLGDKISFFGFCNFLFNERLNYITQPGQLCQQYPLNEYFCYSSHNTYLSGNQITSKNEKSRYIEDLETGIKSVEIDIHGQGQIKHAFFGFSFSKPIQFETVIQEIYKFRKQITDNGNTHYPIILSLQNHVKRNKRQNLLNVLSKYFDDNAYFIEGNESKFPTLAQLKGKIIVKTSTMITETDVFGKIKKNSSKGSKETQSEMGSQLSLQKSQHDKNGKIKRTGSLRKRVKQFIDYEKNNLKQYSKKRSLIQKFKKTQKQQQRYEPMVTVTGIFKSKNGIQNQNPTAFDCTSLSPHKIMKKAKQRVINYTKKSWLRTYPQVSQIRSANYNPCSMLKIGAQMIALNTQTKDDYALMMHCYFTGGRFQSHQYLGYTLKPPYLRSSAKESNQQQFKYIVKITIIQCFGFNIEMTFYGVEEDMQINQKRNNEFFFANHDESFIVFNIDKSYKDCVPVRFLGQGYRVITGRSLKNFTDVGIRILVFVEKTKLIHSY